MSPHLALVTLAYGQTMLEKAQHYTHGERLRVGRALGLSACILIETAIREGL